MTLELHPEAAVPQRSRLAPPAGPLTSARAIFWNERELRAGWRLAIFVLLAFAFAMGGNFVASLLHIPRITASTITPLAMLGQETVGLLAIAAATAIMAYLEGRPFSAYGLPFAGAFGARFWQGMAWGIAMIAAMISLILAFGGFSFGEPALHGWAAWGYAVIWSVVFVAVGLFEEFLFRGYAQFTLTTGLKFWPAAAILSAAFGASHLGNSGEDRVGAFGVFVGGMFFCFTLLRTGNLWFVVGLHAAFDWGETFLFSVPDSGIVAPGHLFNSSLHGQVWLSGGSVGPEASVMAFLVLAFAAAVFARVYPAK